MKGNLNYFDENFDRNEESIQNSQNPVKKNNIKISLDPKESNQYFNEDLNNYSVKEIENSKGKDINSTYPKKAKSDFQNNQQDNNEERNKLKSKNSKKNISNLNNNSHHEQANLEDLKEDEDLSLNNCLDKKIKRSKSKRVLGNNFSNGVLEEVGNSKFIIRTNFHEDEVSSNEKNIKEKKDKIGLNGHSIKEKNCENHQVPNLNKNYKNFPNKSASKKKKIGNRKSKNQKKSKTDENMENIEENNSSKNFQEAKSYASENEEYDNQFNACESKKDFFSTNNEVVESSNSSKPAIQFKNLITNMKSEITNLNTLLNKKRSSYEKTIKTQKDLINKNNLFYNDYNNFLIKFFHFNAEGSNNYYDNGYKNFSFGLDDDLELNENSRKLNFRYLNHYTEDIKHSETNPEFKIIGITPETIYRIKKYQIDVKNLPKISKLFESVINSNDDFYNSQNGKQSNFNANMDSYINDLKFKKKLTVSLIERQNREFLNQIGEKRIKFKHLPKSNKEKMDNLNLNKNWNWIVKKEIPKINKIYIKYKNDLEYNYKKLLTMVNKEVKKKAAKVQRSQKEYNLRAKKLQREMIVFWRKRDKEIIEIKKRKDKYEIEKKKREEELQESIMQKKRLEYLMKQSDIYSFFMHQKLGIAGINENQEANENDEDKKQENPVEEDKSNEIETYDENDFKITKIGDKEVAINPKTNKIIFQSIKVDIDESAAKEGVKQMINKQKEKVMQFDQQINRIRTTLGGEQVNVDKFEECKDEDFALEGLDNPKLTGTASELLEQPKSFLGDLKEYQLKGLRWLDNLYEQGINGILADEMGLGKTIQAISLLAHLSEDKNNWGPFLIVAPNATLYNWQQEVNKFCPSLKVLPYWGALKERKTLRKFFTTNQLYTRNAAFHVCISSYQLVVSDDKVFNRVCWQYMILDEAQAIKNINSQRWNTLLGFNCRNRLLLSGTPIQNSMSELWALLHFIMPNLFDSHEQFQEWFSRDIEAHSQEKGELNQEQLKRLHKILKPFMLRRVKKDVENEIGPKTEHEILCDMTERQKVLYNSIKEKLTNISDLFNSVDSKVKVENLMNLVMQFRKVCNHPELFERHIGKIPFVFRDLVLQRTSTFVNANNTVDLRCDTSSVIKLAIPKLIYDECYEIKNSSLEKLSIFRNKYSSLYDNEYNLAPNFTNLFNFVGLFKFSKTEFLNLINSNLLINHLSLLHYLKELSQKDYYLKNTDIFKENTFHSEDVIMTDQNGGLVHEGYNLFSALNCHISKCTNQTVKKYEKKYFNIFINKFIYSENEEMNFLKRTYYSKNNFPLPNIIFNSLKEVKDQFLYKEFNHHRIFIPKAISIHQDVIISSNRFYRENSDKINSQEMNQILFGKNFKLYNKVSIKNIDKYFIFNNMQNNEYIEKIKEEGILTDLFYKYEGFTEIELPSFEKLISDCAKLKKLDELLSQLKENDHRVLIFCQMTRMIDILEEYMAKRHYTYFRMDGSTNIADRRDMVNEFQTNRKIFAFLLSTRAGGLGVNLTGADTVIFYDNDWNPTMDAQATDRAHRIGQTRPVGVYRLITKHTIEERILKRAKQKQNVQTTVYAGGAFKADIFKQSEIVELLYSEEEVKKLEAERKRQNDLNSNNLMHIDNVGIIAQNEVADAANLKDAKVTKVKGVKKGKETQEKSTKIKKGQVNKEAEKKDAEKINELPNKENVQKSIFSVSNGASKKNIFNTMRYDSSDDENNFIIQDGENPINIDDEAIEANE